MRCAGGESDSSTYNRPTNTFARNISITLFFLSPAFSKKSGGTLVLVFCGAGAWRVVRGAWCVVRGSEFLVGTLSP